MQDHENTPPKSITPAKAALAGGAVSACVAIWFAQNAVDGVESSMGLTLLVVAVAFAIGSGLGLLVSRVAGS
jgi:hypothetical protein